MSLLVVSHLRLVQSLQCQKRRNVRIGDKIMWDDIVEDIRGYCNRDCLYSDNGRCDMWDDFAMPEDVNKCDNYTENF